MIGSRTRSHRDAVPIPAERARSLAERRGRATLLPGPGPGRVSARVSPLLHHVRPRGDAVLLLPDEHPLVAAPTGREAGIPAMLEITDTAPVALREPVRGLLWVSGWLRPLSGTDARAAALDVAETRPDHRLLDVGHGASVLRLRTTSLILADAEGADAVRLEEFSRARPDPFCPVEAHWLRHLEECHADVVEQLASQLPARLRRADSRVRPLGLDRFGLRLRVELGDGDHDVRLRFGRPAADLGELGRELRRLLGCRPLRIPPL